MSKDADNKIIPTEEIAKTKGKRGFQKGNKLAAKVVKQKANELKGIQEEVLKNPKTTVMELLKQRNISAADEMIKAAKRIKDPKDKYKAWADIQKFIEGQRKQVDIKVNKKEEKTILIKYMSKDTNQQIETREPLKPVIEAEYKKAEKELISEIQEEIIDEEDM